MQVVPAGAFGIGREGDPRQDARSLRRQAEDQRDLLDPEGIGLVFCQKRRLGRGVLHGGGPFRAGCGAHDRPRPAGLQRPGSRDCVRAVKARSGNSAGAPVAARSRAALSMPVHAGEQG